MRVVSYLSGIPSKNTSSEKPAILNNFIQGVNAVGDDGISHNGLNILDCDVAVLQGYVHKKSKDLPHLRLRQQVIELQKNRGKKTLVVDSNLFLYQNKSNKPHHYLRYSFDGVFRNTGFYFDRDIDPKRWQQISKDYDLHLKDYRTQGEYVLLCLQRNGGWSMKDNDVEKFCKRAIKEIQQYTDRPIVIRAHPGDKKTYMNLRKKFTKHRFTNIEQPLTQDLGRAWATVVYNSSPGVASLIEGVPVFQLDEQKDFSMYSEVANFDLSQIENPVLYERQDWIERISMCHWNFAETKSGKAWEFMKNYV